MVVLTELMVFAVVVFALLVCCVLCAVCGARVVGLDCDSPPHVHVAELGVVRNGTLDARICPVSIKRLYIVPAKPRPHESIGCMRPMHVPIHAPHACAHACAPCCSGQALIDQTFVSVRCIRDAAETAPCPRVELSCW
jgi:hypothetical protein